MRISLARRMIAFVGCLGLFLPPSTVTAADAEIDSAKSSQTWNQWRGPQRDGVWSGDLPNSLSELKLSWEKPLSPSYSGPVTDGKVVYTTETVDEKFERVTAFDLSSGEQVWTTQWEGAIKVPFFAAANGSWIKATPALTEDALVVLGIRDELVRLNPANGDVQWRVDLSERFGSVRPNFGAVCSPLIDGDAVFVQGGGATLKLSLKDGQTIWRAMAGEEDDDAFSSPIIATVAGVRQLIVQTRTKLCGVSIEDGTELWSEPIEAYRNMNILTPTVIGDQVFTAAHSGRSQMFDISRSGDDWTVTERWNQKVQAYMSSPVVDDQTIYLHSKNERLTALDIESGEILWTGRPMGKYQSLVRNNDVLLALDEGGELLSIEQQRDGLEIRDRLKVADDAWAYLGVFKDGLIVRDLNSLKVYRY
ncbi:outer membrane biogenesis protein BamB [Rubripirellula obstinata]|uniref:Outer membrane biogenesis protein BamB n=1 Tax=Rubripirellula obstinata TaxID=406547 RepID=A0A5B1CKW2_9BACT|nr:PQQ-binding-like beta-propeller repeat protein [Rubripirellula obstinata]KAA1260033.1 outer membrane biogenesis protein BamB [Rubripirellula obstinata]